MIAPSSRTDAQENTVSESLKKDAVIVETVTGSSATSEWESEEFADKFQNIHEPEKLVLSHAERRRRKRDEKRAERSKESGGHTQKKRKLKDGTAKPIEVQSMKRQNSIWVGNLSFKTQHDSLRMFFKEAGEITRINMPTRAPARPGMKPENRGFAYIDFETPEGKVAAIELSEQPLLGRKLLIKDGDNYEGRPVALTNENDTNVSQRTLSKTSQKILGAQKQTAAPTLFLGNLPFETTEDEIRQLLDSHRPRVKKEKMSEAVEENWIRKIRMGTFEDSGLCKGFAFVDFTSVANATAALINPKNHHLNGRNLVVEYASPDAVRRGALKVGRVKHKLDHAKTGNRKEADEEAAKTGKEPSTLQHEKPPHLEDNFKKGKPSCSNGNTWDNTSELKNQKVHKSRIKPGAAFAKAKRETAAIVPSQGKKITF